MPARTQFGVVLVDDTDDSDKLTVAMREAAEGPAVVTITGATVYVSLASVEDFAHRLLEFVGHHRTASCLVCGEKYGPGDLLCNHEDDDETVLVPEFD